MASVDLSELITDVEYAVTPLGDSEVFGTISEDEWVSRLKNAFWSGYNDGLFEGYTCSNDGIVTYVPDVTVTMGRDLQQLVIMYAGINVIQNELLQIKTTFRAKAGPVEYETQQSAQVLKGLLDSFLSQKNAILVRLAQTNVLPVYYVDSIRERDNSLRDGVIDWWGS